jgi:hypothetical protein
MPPDYFIGLDLGQTADPTAVAVLERPPEDEAAGAVYLLRHLHRSPLGTPYTAIVPAVVELCGQTAARGHVTLVVDQTGVGRPVVDMLRRHPKRRGSSRSPSPAGRRRRRRRTGRGMSRRKT